MSSKENITILFIAIDNGTIAKSGMIGMYNEMTYFIYVEEEVENLLFLMDD